jgi:hypothetical protein
MPRRQPAHQTNIEVELLVLEIVPHACFPFRHGVAKYTKLSDSFGKACSCVINNLPIRRAQIAAAVHIAHAAAYACNNLAAAGWAGAQHYRTIGKFLNGVFIGGEVPLMVHSKPPRWRIGVPLMANSTPRLFTLPTLITAWLNPTTDQPYG